MSTTSLLIAFYGLAAVGIVFLLRRYFRRRRKSQQYQAPSVPQELGKERPQAEPLATMTVTAVNGSLADQPPGPTVSASDAMPPKPSQAVRTDSDVSWKSHRLFRSFDTHRKHDDGGAVPPIEPHQLPSVDTSDFAFGSLTPVLAQLLPESEDRSQDTKKELIGAGYLRPHAAQNLAAVRYVAIIVPLVFFGLLLVVVPAPLELPVAGMLFVVPLVGWALPRLYVVNKAADRKKQIERAIPDMLDMLNMCVSQGLTVPESLKRISREMRPVYPALAQELSIVNQQAKVETLKTALQNLSDRIDVPEVHSFTSLVNQTERMGTSITAALTEHSDNMRENLRQRADEKANQAAFKMLFPTVLFMMPAVFIFLLGPAIVELSNFFEQGGRDAIDAGRVEALQRINQNPQR